MNQIDNLFFELIRVAIGTQDSLSRLPKAREWGELYRMAEKQSLVGVCFAALQRLGADADEGFARIGMSEMQYLTWMGMTAKIQQRNQDVDRQCAELGEKLKAEGYRYCILKGQGVASLYSEHLRGLRQSGDIDVLMWKDGLSEKENRNAIVEYAQKLDARAKASEHHIAVKMFEDTSTGSAQVTEVEMHYAPAYLCNPLADRKFKKWSNRLKVKVERLESPDIYVPCTEFNVVFMLAHAFRHYMSEGVGMRQMMDYYFVLKALEVKVERLKFKVERLKIKELLDSLNMLKFAGAVMFVMKDVFGLDEKSMICEPNEKLGRKLLAHIMEGGNFGHHNKKTIASKKTHSGRFLNQVVQDMKLAIDYPGEALWAPLSMIREFVRIRI